MKMLFTTERLLVREFELQDWRTAHAYAQLAEVVQYQNWGPNSERQTKAFIRDTLAYQAQHPRRHHELCVCLQDGAHIGGCGIAINRENAEKALIGYILHPDHWNKGYITELVARVLLYCRDELHLKEIGATCDTRNIASQRVLEKTGFVQMREVKNDFMQKGIWRDTYRYEYPLSVERRADIGFESGGSNQF